MTLSSNDLETDLEAGTNLEVALPVKEKIGTMSKTGRSATAPKHNFLGRGRD
jgi:hypothetical protein